MTDEQTNGTHVAYCGIKCHECGPFKACKQDSDELRAEVALCWSQALAREFKPDELNCMGCCSDAGPHFCFTQTCPVRICARGREAETCAHCPDYPCELLEAFFETMPYARTALEELRKEVIS